MKRALAASLFLSLISLAGCGGSDEKPEGEGGQPESVGGDNVGPAEPQRPPLADSYAGKWQKPDDGAVLEVKDEAGTISATLLEDSAGRYDKLEINLQRQPGNLLVGTCKVTAKDLPECELKLELFAAEGGGLQGRRQVAVVDEDGSFVTFEANPMWEDVKYGVTAPPPPEPEPTTVASSEQPTSEEPTEQPTEPTEQPTEPTEPTEQPTEPTEQPTEPTEPTEQPTEPTEPAEPAEPTEQPTEPTEQPTGEEPTEQPTGEEPTEPTEPPAGIETDPEAQKAAEEARQARLARQKALAELRDRRKSPEGLVKVLFEAIQGGNSQLFSNCLINDNDGQFLFGPDGQQQAKLTRRSYGDQVWGPRAEKFPGLEKATFVKLEGTEQQGKRAKEMRDATLVYNTADGKTEKVLIGYIVQVEDGSWKAYRPESQE